MITTPVQGAAAPEALRLADSYANAHAMYCMENIYGTSESYTAALLEKRHCEREMLGVELRRLHALVEGLSAAQGDEKYNDTLIPFVSLMRKELHANASKGDRPGWLKMSADTALLEIYWHTAKLSAAVKNNDGPEIIEHSADVANMAMMLLDVCGGLGFPASPAQPAPLPAEPVHGDVLPPVGSRVPGLGGAAQEQDQGQEHLKPGKERDAGDEHEPWRGLGRRYR